MVAERTGRTPAAQARSDVENDALEVLVREGEQLAFTRRVVEDLARIRYAASHGLIAETEQMAARLLVVSQRRHRQIAHADVDLTRWGIG